jgi:HlyD family secretion protein
MGRRATRGVVGLTLTLLVTVFVPRLNRAPPNLAPSIERGTVWPDTVKRGPWVRQVRTADGIVDLERLEDVVYVGRPAFGAENSTISLFKVVPGCDLTQTTCEAVRQRVRLGRSSVNTIEVLEGLEPGDQVVLSDMSAYDGVDRVRLN